MPRLMPIDWLIFERATLRKNYVKARKSRSPGTHKIGLGTTGSHTTLPSKVVSAPRPKPSRRERFNCTGLPTDFGLESQNCCPNGLESQTCITQDAPTASMPPKPPKLEAKGLQVLNYVHRPDCPPQGRLEISIPSETNLKTKS